LWVEGAGAVAATAILARRIRKARRT
jgi:hypothetical protein